MIAMQVKSEDFECSRDKFRNPPVLAIEEACRRIPPLWPLKDFVAVNPFLGLTDHHFLQASRLFRRVGHGEMMMTNEYYLDRLNSGKITEEDIGAALAFARMTIPPPWSAFLGEYDVASLRRDLSSTAEIQYGWILSVADYTDKELESSWTTFITDEISKWCSVYFDEGQSSWRMPWRDRSLYKAWREAARLDANPGLSGLSAFGRIIRALPDDPIVVIEKVLSLLAIPPGFQADFLHRHLLSVSGWSAHVQYRARQDGLHGRTNTALAELLAIRMAYDWALWEQFRLKPGFESGWEEAVIEMQRFDPALDLLPRYLLLCAAEKSYQRQISARLLASPIDPESKIVRNAVHAVFCIDVRSEVFRRHLEGQDKRIATSGFAGFFGMPIEYIPLGRRHGSPQCPVLFAPKYKVREGLQAGNAKDLDKRIRSQLFGQRVTHAWNAFKTSAISCFSFVETAGLWFGYKLGCDALAFRHDDEIETGRNTGPGLDCEPGHEHRFGIPHEDQIHLAEGALRNLGLTSNFARLILFCGHGSSSANNPYVSSLDCGACGGHAGGVNARVLARILNRPIVRETLRPRGIEIPEDTYFLAGQHNTMTDEIAIFDEQAIPISHQNDLAQIRKWLSSASRQARMERAKKLGLNLEVNSLRQTTRKRSQDWAEVRPEWGLANNAALIAAPRSRTRGLNLEGRTFLHDYDTSGDPGGKVLELILTAPVVVANWINLQYYASTVNNRHFGSGNKTIHNVVGALGIWQGNGGDLQVGLPLQSLHNGETWMHEPLRLSVYVQASLESINRVLNIHPEIRELVQNGWMHLFAIEPATAEIKQYLTNFSWEALNSDASPLDKM
jgi:uncharacterized protein YbcC (UPF0753/DUF2309 family)